MIAKYLGRSIHVRPPGWWSQSNIQDGCRKHLRDIVELGAPFRLIRLHDMSSNCDISQFVGAFRKTSQPRELVICHFRLVSTQKLAPTEPCLVFLEEAKQMRLQLILIAEQKEKHEDFGNKRPGLTLVCSTSLSLLCHGIDV